MRHYLDLLRTPRAARFTIAGLFARLPLSMAGLGLVLLTELRTGSYATAGAVAAVYVAASGVGALGQGRACDRLGQAPVLLLAGALHLVGMLGVLVAPGSGTPWVWVVVAGVAAPQAGNLVRARWAHVLSSRPPQDRRRSLETAFALEAVFDEVVFVTGPVLVTVLTLQVAPVSGLLVSAIVSTAASWALAAQRGTEPAVGAGPRGATEKLRWALLVPLATIAIGVGALFGSTEVIVAAFTDERGRSDLAGLVLATWATGSLVAGLVVGARSSGLAPLRRLRWASTGLAALFVPLLLVDTVALLLAGMLAAGLMIAPTMIALTRTVEVEVSATRLTEAFAWVSTGLSAGLSIGAAAAGRVVDDVDASAGFSVPLVAGGAAAIIAWTILGKVARTSR